MEKRLILFREERVYQIILLKDCLKVFTCYGHDTYHGRIVTVGTRHMLDVLTCTWVLPSLTLGRGGGDSGSCPVTR